MSAATAWRMTRLKTLVSATNDALEDAKLHKENFDGDMIDWEDLHCATAEFYQTNDGGVGYRVFIDESGDNAAKLHRHVVRWLKENSFGDVEVRTEW